MACFDFFLSKVFISKTKRNNEIWRTGGSSRNSVYRLASHSSSHLEQRYLEQSEVRLMVIRVVVQTDYHQKALLALTTRQYDLPASSFSTINCNWPHWCEKARDLPVDWLLSPWTRTLVQIWCGTQHILCRRLVFPETGPQAETSTQDRIASGIQYQDEPWRASRTWNWALEAIIIGNCGTFNHSWASCCSVLRSFKLSTNLTGLKASMIPSCIAAKVTWSWYMGDSWV